jgi:hypothetical protein
MTPAGIGMAASRKCAAPRARKRRTRRGLSAGGQHERYCGRAGSSLTWRHPVQGSISPRRFIPIAEETGLVVPISAWVLEQARIQGARWLKAGYRNACISVNVSAREIRAARFCGASVASAPDCRVHAPFSRARAHRKLSDKESSRGCVPYARDPRSGRQYFHRRFWNRVIVLE